MKRVRWGSISVAVLVTCFCIVLAAQAAPQRGAAGQAPQGQGGRGGGRGPAGPQMRGDGPAPDPKPFSITRSDPALDAVIDPNAKLETIASGVGINEGVLW